MRSSGAPHHPGSIQPSAPMQTIVRQAGSGGLGQAYPSLRDFMGLELSEEMIRANMPEYLLEKPPTYPAIGNAEAGNNVGTVATRQPSAGTNN